MLIGLAIVGFAIYMTIKFLYGVFFAKERREDNGYKAGWFGKEPSPLTDDDVKVSVEDISIRPFKIEVLEDVLTDLQKRLENTRLAEPLEDVKFLYGFNPHYLREVVDYWKTQYKWRKHEADLNKYSHFKTKIEGIDVHFMHIKPTIPEGRDLKVIPLLVVHGWPGSIAEFYKIIPFLTSPRPGHDFVFEVICPSIPGYGFSEPAHRTGFNVRAAARIFVTLMDRLGHQKFYVQGGDWGSAIVITIARYYPGRLFGVHVNMFAFGMRPWDALKCAVVAWLPFLISKEEYNFLYPLKKKASLLYQESGYFHMQSTKPDTIGCALSDTPAGLAAYILEKFSIGTNAEYVNLPDGGLTKKFTLDELLTNIMLYWVNDTFASGARFYKENLRSVYRQTQEKIPVTVPSAVAAFPHEVLMYPKMMLSQQLKNLVSYNIMPRGGHFAAMEEPELLADDVWNFVGLVEK